MQTVVDVVAGVCVAVIVGAFLAVLALAWQERPARRKGGKR